jgi:WD40 repeat protein
LTNATSRSFAMKKYASLQNLLIVLLFIIALMPSVTSADNSSTEPAVGIEQPTDRPPITATNADLVTQLARLGRGTVDAMAWSPDGSALAVAGSAGVWVYDPSDLAARPLVLDGHTRDVYSLAFSPDGSILASGSYPTIILWDAKTGEQLAVLSGLRSRAEDIVFSPDGSTLVAGTGDDIRRWEIATGIQLDEWTVHEDSIQAIAFSPEGDVIATGSEDNTVRITDAQTGDLVKVLAAHSETITGLAYSPDGQMLLSASRDRNIRLWDTTTYEEITTIEDLDNGVRGATFGPDDAVLVSWSQQGFVRLWDTTTYRMLTTVRADAVVAALSPDGRTLATSTADHAISLWTISEDYRSAQLTQEFYPSGHSEAVNSVAFLPESDKLISCSGARFSPQDATVRLWDTNSNTQLAILAEYSDGLLCATSPSEELIAVAQRETIKLIDGESGAELTTLEGHEDRILTLMFSPDGAILASTDADASVRLWDVATGEQVALIEGHADEIQSLAFSPDGTMLAIGESRKMNDETTFTIRLWDIATDTEVAVLEGHTGEIGCLAFSSDGHFLVSGSRYPDETIRLWNVATGNEELVIYEDVTADAIAFSPNGEVFATLTTDGLLRLWDAENWYPIAVFEANAENLAFSPDSTMLATGSADATVRLWGVDSTMD